jgi:hypothetical protein
MKRQTTFKGMIQTDTSLSYNEAKTTVKAALRTNWRNGHPEYDQNNNIYRLTRREHVIIFHLRTGHYNIICTIGLESVRATCVPATQRQ